MGPVLAHRTGVVIIGSGVAGLSAALASGPCVVITATALGAGGSSPLAQGGVAAAVDSGDSAKAHAADTIAVSAGLAVESVVDLVVDQGPTAIDELIAIGANFDRAADGNLALGREAGHGVRRIVHANGDATGAEIMARLTAAVQAKPEVEVLSGRSALDLIMSNGRVVGVLTSTVDGRSEAVLGDDVIMATGGYAHSFAQTTTPAESIGSGIVMAARAGATLADMEFVQFHPTALDVGRCSGVASPGVPDDRLPLLTEALRGEGATLVDSDGHRFLLGQHPDAELAPRDVVARANYRELAAGREVFLDARAAVGTRFDDKFPTVAALTRAVGLDPTTEPIPVTPAAHYCMGGIAVDRYGRSSLPGLWAIGETAASGLHGANRLASNSLLEGLVMGNLVGQRTSADRATAPRSQPRTARLQVGIGRIGGGIGQGNDPRDEAALIAELRQILWRSAGVERHADGLRQGLSDLAGLAGQAQSSPRAATVHSVAAFVAAAALRRTESRGAHFRLDHPDRDPTQAVRNSWVSAPVSSRELRVLAVASNKREPSLH